MQNYAQNSTSNLRPPTSKMLCLFFRGLRPALKPVTERQVILQVTQMPIQPLRFPTFIECWAKAVGLSCYWLICFAPLSQGVVRIADF
ncbi:MAG: hypothetical protein K6U74_18740, partial [Firmicutes bacterium]|nr:hypothetical protein [Bacillota bacterium]